MKLKKGIVLGSVEGEDFAIATGKAAKEFNGVIHNNKTAAYIFSLLKTEQSQDSLVKALMQKYDVNEETAREDIREIIATIIEAGVLDD